MSISQLTIIVVVCFLSIIFYIAYKASKSNIATPEDYYLGGRKMGTFILLMTMGASFFSTWTLLGAIGSYYREGIWFVGFGVWTICHALFIWLFGIRIWLAGKKYNFVTPGQMIDHYYKDSKLSLLFSFVGILALVPYMLIQVTGGALALSGLTNNEIPYSVGVIIMTIMVGVLVLLSGFRGAAWTDTFMGVFFGAILIIVGVIIVEEIGGVNVFKTVAETNPGLLVNKGNIPGMLEMMFGIGLAFWVMPHMWQKYYSAKSPEVLGKVSIYTPFWNSWLMAIVPLVIGIGVTIPGIIPGMDTSSSDQILPLFFAHYAPVFGTIVIAGVLAAAISTINSQLLSSASLFVTDIYLRFSKKELSKEKETFISKVTVGVLTLIIFILAITPGGAGFLVPIASYGFAIALQLIPASLGVFYWKRITAAGSFAGIVLGLITLITLVTMKIPAPGFTAFIVNLFITVVVSLFTQQVSAASIKNYHDMFREYLSSTSTEDSIHINNEGERLNA